MILEIAGVRMHYGPVTALDGVDLGIAPGEVLGLLGPNGAGKTTLMSIVAGVRRADEGDVRVAGHDVVCEPGRARACVGYAPQELGVYPTLTVTENLTFFGELAGLWGARLQHRISEVTQALGLGPLRARRAGRLSGGERRRLHVACALVHAPPLVLLDEPTAGADPEAREAMLEVVQRIASDGGAVLYATHYLLEVETLRAGVAIIDHGRIAVRDNVDALIARYGEPAITLTFDGPVPRRVGHERAARNGCTMTVGVPNPGVALPRVLASLGEDAARVAAVEVIQPSLEAVYLSLTGRRYQGDGDAS